VVVVTADGRADFELLSVRVHGPRQTDDSHPVTADGAPAGSTETTTASRSWPRVGVRDVQCARPAGCSPWSLLREFGCRFGHQAVDRC
jgi:hypothetical protein